MSDWSWPICNTCGFNVCDYAAERIKELERENQRLRNDLEWAAEYVSRKGLYASRARANRILTALWALSKTEEGAE